MHPTIALVSFHCRTLQPISKNFKKRIDATNLRVEFDNRAVLLHKAIYQRPPKTHRNYPHWNGHPAKKYLEDDVRNGIADIMAPKSLRGTREPYKDFPTDVFCKRVNSEKQKQKADAFWVEKQNRKGMKQCLAEVSEV